MKKQLIFIRGFPGSGKSTLAEKLAKEKNAVIRTTDDFFMIGGEYRWTGKFISPAHKWNQSMVAHDMFLGRECIIVPNTGIKAWEYLAYCELAADNDYEVVLLEPKTKWAKDPQQCFEKCTHNVPLATIERMAKEMESLKSIASEITSKLNTLGKSVNVVLTA